MRLDLAVSNGLFRISIIVALVEADVVGSARATRCVHDNAIEDLRDQPLIMDVRTRDLSRERYTTTIR
jgi:hypothetical protein